MSDITLSVPLRNLTQRGPPSSFSDDRKDDMQKDVRRTLWSDSYEADLYDLRDTLRAHAWAHDKRAADFRMYYIFYLVSLSFLGASISASSTILNKVYGDVSTAVDAAIFVAQIGGALVTALTALNLAFSPARERSDHITAIVNKMALEGEIAEELHKNREDRRWLADDFFKHVNDMFAVMDSQSPYLPMGLVNSAPINKVRRPQYILDFCNSKNTPDTSSPDDASSPDDISSGDEQENSDDTIVL